MSVEENRKRIVYIFVHTKCARYYCHPGSGSFLFADAFPYIFKDMGRYYAVVKKCYRNIDLRKNVIGLNIINAKNLSLLYNKLTWPLWESIESIHHGAVVIKKGDSMYGMATVDKFPTCNLVNMAYSIKRDQEEDAVYYIQKSDI